MFKAIVGGTALLAVIFAVQTARADVLLYEEVPALTGTFVHGQAAISVTVDFGVEFIWGPEVYVEITGTGTDGTATGGSFPAELLVSVYTPGGTLVVPPKVLGPYGGAPAMYTTSELTGDLGSDLLGASALGSVFEIVIETNDIYSDILTPAMVDITNVTVYAFDNDPNCGSIIGGCDGFVGIEDLNIVLSNWNQDVTPGDYLRGELTGDGFVGIEDLNLVLGNWNAGTPPVAAVPEPGAVAWLSVLALLSVGRRR